MLRYCFLLLTIEGKFRIGDQDFDLNNEFKNEATELSDMLDLNETEACTLLYEARTASEELDRTPSATAVIRFHAYRTFLVDSLRLLLKIILDDEQEDEIREALKKRFESILSSSQGRKEGSAFTQKCLDTMRNIEHWLNRISDQIQKMITVGQVSNANQDEVMGLQQQHLSMQHESLGAIITYLVKLDYTSLDNLKKLLAQIHQLDKWNTLVIHYVPVIISFFYNYGSVHRTVTHIDSRSIHKILVEGLDGNPWPLRQFQGAVLVWWLAEYNSWYFDLPDEHVGIEDEDGEKEANIRTDALAKALSTGAFQCILSICSQMTSSDWYDPARLGLIRTLLNDAFVLPQESATISQWYVEIVFEHLEIFTSSFIQNLPNALREFKSKEEDQRRQYINGLSSDIANELQEPDKHLERFFVIMSYAYEGRPEAANAFWEDTEGYLYGFLQWFSRRVSTPLVGAFCEMFRAISVGEEFANAAHTFLTDTSQAATSRARRATSLSWEQIFEELEFYANKVRDSPIAAVNTSSYGAGKTKSIDVDEPETPVMLESYLRLISHLCLQSASVRTWILSQTRCKVIDTVFALSNSSVPSRIRACAYGVLTGLSAEQTPEVHSLIWNSLDQWVSVGFPSTRPSRITNSVTSAANITFETIALDFEEMSAFIDLLNVLITPQEISQLYGALPFPESLGSSHRMPGIDPYIDFVLGTMLAQKALSFDTLKARILCSKIFHFVRIALGGFNERILLLAQQTGQSLDDTIDCSSLVTYVHLHPFSRTMEWMFNEKFLKVLFLMSHHDVSEISNTLSTAPANVSLLGAIEVMNLIMQLQTTYLDVVRPLLKAQFVARRQPVSNPSLTSFEDSISVHLRLITDLTYYAGTCHEDLALPSLELLKQFAKSRKLNNSQVSKISPQLLNNRLIDILQGNNDTDPVSKALGDLLDWDERELESGTDAPCFRIKFAILDFIEETLKASEDIPNMAHALLGFQCNGLSVSLDSEGIFMQRASLFHKIANLSLYYPCAVDGSLEYGLLNLKTKAWSIVHILWNAKLTSSLVMAALAEFPYLESLWINTPLVGSSTLWQGHTYQEADFMFSDAARAFECFLRQRSFLYTYAASQVRLLTFENSLTARNQLLSIAFGSSDINEGVGTIPSIFDLLDFLDVDLSKQMPDLTIGTPADWALYENCITTGKDGIPCFDMDSLEQLLTLKISHLQRNPAGTDSTALDKAIGEKDDVLSYFNGLNNQQAIQVTRIAALRAWADLLLILFQQGGLEAAQKTSVTVQALQIISPRLELFANAYQPETHILAQFVRSLVADLDLKSTALLTGRVGEVVQERLFELFKVSLKAISYPDTTIELRESFYNICHQYLDSAISRSENNRDNTMQVIRAVGEWTIETISEDAFGSAGTSSMIALLLLDALARSAMDDNSTYIIDLLARNNFLTVLVEALSRMLIELDQSPKAGKSPTDTLLPHN